MSRPLAFAVAALGILAGSLAEAETYRCQGPDGKTLFTSDRSLCPSAEPHQTKGRIQRSQGAPARTDVALEPARAPARRALHEDAEAQTWRARRARAEAELAQAERQLETLHEVAGWCNRGHEVWAKDADGLKHGVECDDVKAQEQALRREARRLEAYLDEGLEEECRRAGCLPGWIRQ